MEEVLDGRCTDDPVEWAARVKTCLEDPEEQLDSLRQLGESMYEDLLLAGG